MQAQIGRVKQSFQVKFLQIFNQSTRNKVVKLQRKSQDNIWFLTATIAQLFQGKLFSVKTVSKFDDDSKIDHTDINAIWKFVMKKQSFSIFITLFNDDCTPFNFNTTGHHMGRVCKQANKILEQKKIKFEIIGQQKLDEFNVGDFCILRIQIELNIVNKVQNQIIKIITQANEYLRKSIVNLWLNLFDRAKQNKQNQQISQEIKKVLTDKTNILQRQQMKKQQQKQQQQKFQKQFYAFVTLKRKQKQQQGEKNKKYKCLNIENYKQFKSKIKKKTDISKYHLSWHVLKLSLEQKIRVVNTLLSQFNLISHQYSSLDTSFTSTNLVQIRSHDQKFLMEEISKKYPLMDIQSKQNEIRQKAKLQVQKFSNNMKNYIHKLVDIRHHQKLKYPNCYLRLKTFCKAYSNAIHMEFVKSTLLEKIKEISSNKYNKYLQGLLYWYDKLFCLILPLIEKQICLLHCDLKQNNVVYDQGNDQLLFIDLQSIRHSNSSQATFDQQIILLSPFSEKFNLKQFHENLKKISFYEDPLLLISDISNQIRVLKIQFQRMLKQQKIDEVYINNMRKRIAEITYELVLSTSKIVRPPQVKQLVQPIAFFLKHQNLSHVDLILNGKGVNTLFHKNYDFYCALTCLERKIQIFANILPANYERNVSLPGRLVIELLFKMLQRKHQILQIGKTKWDYYCGIHKQSQKQKYTIPKSYMLLFWMHKFQEIMKKSDNYIEFIK